MRGPYPLDPTWSTGVRDDRSQWAALRCLVCLLPTLRLPTRCNRQRQAAASNRSAQSAHEFLAFVDAAADELRGAVALRPDALPSPRQLAVARVAQHGMQPRRRKL